MTRSKTRSFGKIWLYQIPWAWVKMIQKGFIAWRSHYLFSIPALLVNRGWLMVYIRFVIDCDNDGVI